MDIYCAVETFLSKIPTVMACPEIKTCILRMAAQKIPDWQLPLKACLAVGGTMAQATAAVAAIACAQMSIILVDDMLDIDPRGEYHRIGMPAAANMAVALAAISTEALAQNKEDFCHFIAVKALNEMMSQTAWGQFRDVEGPADEASYWQLVRLKSSPFFKTALYIGALLGGATAITAQQLAAFGALYGEMIQIHDDLNDTLEAPANLDWLQGRSPLPILFAQTVEHPERADFIALRSQIADPHALAKAQLIVIRSGAVSYCIDQFLQRYQTAQDLLSHLELANREPVTSLLEPLINPVQTLYTELALPDSVEIGKRTAARSLVATDE